MAIPDNARGVALVDLDEDGRLDVVVANQHSGPTLLRNKGDPGHWIGLRLVGALRCGSAALGSTVTVQVPDEAPHVREVQAVNGFAAQHDSRIHVGLGRAAPPIVPVTVSWCGAKGVTYQLRTGRYHEVRQS